MSSPQPDFTLANLDRLIRRLGGYSALLHIDTVLLRSDLDDLQKGRHIQLAVAQIQETGEESHVRET